MTQYVLPDVAETGGAGEKAPSPGKRQQQQQPARH